MSEDVSEKMDGTCSPRKAIQLIKSRHTKFLSRILNVLPECFSSMETTRMTLVYFSISALDVLGELDQVLSLEEKASTISWIYSLQVCSNAFKRYALQDIIQYNIFLHGN